MTLVAFNIRVFSTGQLEFGFLVVESGFFPILCVMTAAAIKAELAFMNIILLMA